MHLFYTPDIDSTTYTLNEEESKHSVRVLRLKIGDNVVLIDGKGGWHEGIIKNDHPKGCVVEVVNSKKEFEKRNTYLHIAIAPTKNMNRIEWFIEKSTEVGIDEITCIECHHNKRTTVKSERLNKVAVSAMKQSYKSYLPKINELTDIKTLVDSQSSLKAQKFIAHCYPSFNKNKTPKKALKNIYQPGSDVVILIGPEGDFTPEEVNYALSKGFEEISLGNARLRTETAALYTCMAIDILNAK